MSHGLSFVICCHNSAARLPQTLESLGRLKTNDSTGYEVVVVDNASSDATAQVAVRFCPPKLRDRLRVVREDRLGLSYARHRGVMEARFDIISFIDDDNWVYADWVQRALAIFEQSPLIGAIGGPSSPVFETSPPEWFDSLKGFFAVGSQHSASGDITAARGTLLWGGGLTVRKVAFLNLLENGFHFLLSDRSGASLSTGGDTEICYALRASGWIFWYDEHLVLEHYIPTNRLTPGYLSKLMRAMGEAAAVFNLYLIALGLHPFDNVPWYKKTWGYQMAKTVINLAQLKLQLGQKQANDNGMCLLLAREQNIRGHLSALWKTRQMYRQLIQQVIAAPWNVASRQSKVPANSKASGF